MIVLGLDGALGAFSAAVARDGRAIAEASAPGQVALERGLVILAGALRDAGVAPRSLDGIAVGIGPGGFTGLRIAVSYAKSLAQAWHLPLTGISSYDLLEAGYESHRVLTVVHGRAGVISARFRYGAAESRASGRVTDVLDAVLPRTLRGTLSVAGMAEDVLAPLAERGLIVQPLAIRSSAAAAVAVLGCTREAATSLHEIRADYGEQPAARLPRPQ